MGGEAIKINSTFGSGPRKIYLDFYNIFCPAARQYEYIMYIIEVLERRPNAKKRTFATKGSSRISIDHLRSRLNFDLNKSIDKNFITA
jgi:hypothetical protein